MKYVDPIIRYLSGEMEPEEKERFETEVTANPRLSEELKEASGAFGLIRDRLQRMDEDAFRRKLAEVMEKRPEKKPVFIRSRRAPWYAALALAASVAIVAALILEVPSPHRLFSRYYDPEGDQVLLAFGRETRGELQGGIALFRSGRYASARQQLQKLAEEEPGNYLVHTYLVLCAIELGFPADRAPEPDRVEAAAESPAGQAYLWYTALALIRSEEFRKALPLVSALSKTAGPYRRDARRMKKVLLK